MEIPRSKVHTLIRAVRACEACQKPAKCAIISYERQRRDPSMKPITQPPIATTSSMRIHDFQYFHPPKTCPLTSLLMQSNKGGLAVTMTRLSSIGQNSRRDKNVLFWRNLFDMNIC